MIGGHHHGLIPGYGAHRRECVHRLGPGRAGNGVHAECGHAPGGKGLYEIRIGQRGQEGDQGRAGLEEVQLSVVWPVHLEDKLRLPIEAASIGNDRCPGGRVGVIADEGSLAGAGLDQHRDP